MIRRALVLAAVLLAIAVWQTAPASAQTSVTRQDAITQLGHVRDSIDETLSLLKSGQDDAAFDQAKSGYLDHFELVEVPLRVVDPALTVRAEAQFAEIRELIRNHASVDDVRTKV